MPFCGGRTDATSDDGASEFLEPTIVGNIDETGFLLKEFIKQKGLTNAEYAALHGAGYAVGQSNGCCGLYCGRNNISANILSNTFFQTVLSNDWKRNNAEDMYTPVDSVDSYLHMYAADVQFSYDQELKPISERFAFDNNLFLDTVAFAWTKLANADRFDGPIGSVCASGKYLFW